MFEHDLFDNAGRFINPHTMVWIRKFDVPVTAVWEAVSTKPALDTWWICPVEIDLRPGGKFSHHWENTITDLNAHEFINFGDEAVGPLSMRFEMKADCEGTVFSFIDTWALDIVPKGSDLPESASGIDTVQPGGPGTPWAGVAGGWHCAIDDLEAYLTGRAYNHSYEHLSRFYAAYLKDHFRWLKLMPPR